MKIVLLLFFISVNTYAQFFGLFGNKNKDMPTPELIMQIEKKMDELVTLKDEQKDEQVPVAYDELTSLLENYRALSIIECPKKNDKNSCLEKVIEFEVKLTEKMYSIRKELMIKSHNKNLTTLDELKSKQIELINKLKK